MTDPIADMLTRIRNAQMVKSPEVLIPVSKFKRAILKVLKNSGYIKNYKIKHNTILVDLNYQQGEPAITKIKKVSRPGLKNYTSSRKIPHVMQGFGMVVISTSKGVMSGKEARGKNLGGEIICEIY